MPIINQVVKGSGGGGTTPPMYVEYVVDNGSLKKSDTTGAIGIDWSTVTTLPNNVLSDAYTNNIGITGSIDLSNVTYFGTSCLKSAFASTNLSGSIVIHSSIESTSLSGAFLGTRITSVVIDGEANQQPLVISSNGCNGMCSSCYYLTSVVIGPDTRFGSSSGSSSSMRDAFSGCSALASADVSGVTTMQNSSSSSGGAARSMFENDDLLTSQNWASLVTIGRYAMQRTYAGCTNLQDLYFPRVNMSSFNGYTNQFQDMLLGVDNCTIHFPANLENAGLIENMAGYDPNAPFGASAGSVVFDLPSTVVLTGADTRVYVRNPKYDTPYALCWSEETYLTSSSKYYTAGTTDPAVSDTIYSDSDCTIPETTIDSIA